MLALFFVGRQLGSDKLARGGLALGLGVGTLLGAARMMQGAHFFSHMLWSALACWTVALLLARLLIPKSVARSARPSHR